ncbi:MAG: hypothetical protein ACF8LL_05195 [Phycisphaerales bacterium]
MKCKYDLRGVSGPRCPECGDAALPMELGLVAEPPFPEAHDQRALTEFDRDMYRSWTTRPEMTAVVPIVLVVAGLVLTIVFALFRLIRRLWSSAPNVFGGIAGAAVALMGVAIIGTVGVGLLSNVRRNLRMRRLVPLDLADGVATEHVLRATRAFRIVQENDVTLVLVGDTHAAIVGSMLVASVVGRGAPACRSEIHFDALPRSGLGLREGWHGDLIEIEDLEARVREVSVRNIMVVSLSRLRRHVRPASMLSRSDPLRGAGISSGDG